MQILRDKLNTGKQCKEDKTKMARNYGDTAGQYSAISGGSNHAPWVAIPTGRVQKPTVIRRTSESGFQQAITPVVHQLNASAGSLPLPTGVRIPVETEEVYRTP